MERETTQGGANFDFKRPPPSTSKQFPGAAEPSDEAPSNLERSGPRSLDDQSNGGLAAQPPPALPMVVRSLAARLEATPRIYLIGWLAIWAPYLLIMHFTLGNRLEQFIGCAITFVMCFWTDWSRRLWAGLAPFFAQGLIYDLTHITEPFVRYLHVHIVEPYGFDLSHFGIRTSAGILTPNEFFAVHHWPVVDFFTGLAYILYLYLVVGLLIVLALAKSKPDWQRLGLRFGWAFFIMSVVGYATYYIYPAAPPWYVAAHGFGPPDFSVQASLAGAARWDALTGFHYFHAFYGRSADVFGALPSLHVGAACLSFLYARELRKWWLTAFTFAFYVLMCFSAVYLGHHYVLDVLLGSVYAVGALLFERLYCFLARVPVLATSRVPLA